MSDSITRTEEIRSAVRQRYGRIARDFDAGQGASCCGPADCCSDAGTTTAGIDFLYETPEAATLPPEVTGLSLGCGDPVTLASLQPGQTVLDLGSGGGIDCFLAARQVGPEGSVIGVDMTPEMLDRARSNARRLGLENVQFRLGEIEHLPAGDGTVDVVLSNCVINLSPDKHQVFREAYRVLKPGGRLAVSDIVTRAPLPPEIHQDSDAWAACIAGAWTDQDYVAAVEAAGFVETNLEAKTTDGEPAFLDPAELDLAVSGGELERLIYSARVTAVKPTTL
jgi:SAM-dependent methyltransferase